MLAISLAAWCGLVTVFGSPGSTFAAGSHAGLPTLRVVNWIAPNLALAHTLDPAQVSAISDIFVISLADENVARVDTSGKIAKQLATRISVSKNRKTYTFTIRKGARFENGDRITANTFVYSIKRALAPATASSVNYYDDEGFGDILGAHAYITGKSTSLPGVKALDASTLQIRLSSPIAYFLYALTYPVNDAVDPKVTQGQVAKTSGNYLTSNCPAARANASGQFTFQCTGTGFFPSGETPRYDLVPNPTYSGPFKKPKIKMELLVEGNSETSYNEYLSGAVDMIGLPSQHIAAWKKNPRGQLYGGPQCPKPGNGCPTTNIFYMVLNATEPPFNNANCRLAVAWGINRKNLASIFQGSQAAYNLITPPGLGIMNKKALAGLTKQVPNTNLSKARSFMSKCPASDRSAQIQYVYATGDASATAYALAEVQSMKDLGFSNANAVGKSQNDWNTDNYSPMSQTHIQGIDGGWSQDYPDPQDYMTLLWSCGASYNIGGYCNKQADTLMKAGDVAPTAAARIRDYNQAQKILLNSGYPIMELNGVRFGLKKTYVQGIQYYVTTGRCPVHCDWSKVVIKKH
jgi:oligopeptide transport system substrate-binding protein